MSIRAELNRICLDCPHLNDVCGGTHESAYSGCIWKAGKAADLHEYRVDVYGIDRAEQIEKQIRERGNKA